MTTNLELYGIEDVPRVPAEHCNTRLYLLNKRLGEVLAKGTLGKDNYTISQILKAQKFWKSLRDGEESFE